MQKNEFGPLPYSIQIDSLKIDQSYLNISAKTYKLLGEDIGVNLCKLGLDNFLDMTQKAKGIKRKISKLDYIKIKNICTSNDTTKKVKKQSTD